MPELELKLDVPAERRDAVLDALQSLSDRQSSLHRERLVSIYLDTADRSLARHRIALRLRRDGDRWEQTLKAAADAPVDRLEENVDRPGEWPSDGPPVDITLHQHSNAGKKLRAALDDSRDARLAPVFVSDFIRHRVDIDVDGSRVEVAFDEGELRAGAVGPTHDGHANDDASAAMTSMPPMAIHELEFELKQGSPQALVTLGAQWIERYGLWLNTISKAARGSLLAAGETRPAPTTARIAELQRGQHLDACALLRRWTAVCLEQVLDNASLIAAADAPPAPELIHQLRVGIRRLRSIWRELGDCAPAGADAWQQPVRELFAALGQVRDRDEAVARYADAIAQAGGPPIDPHVFAGDDPDLPALIRAPAFQQAMLLLLRFAIVDDGTKGPDEGDGAGDGIAVVGRRLSKLHKGLRHAAKRFARISDDERHKARKRAKRLRYLAELAQPLYSAKEVKAYLKRLKVAQQHLGDYQDLCTAADAYRHAAGQGQHQAWFGAGWLQAEKAGQIDACHRALRRVARADRFW